jgi:hypothetical protein
VGRPEAASRTASSSSASSPTRPTNLRLLSLRRTSEVSPDGTGRAIEKLGVTAVARGGAAELVDVGLGEREIEWAGHGVLLDSWDNVSTP